MPCISKTKVFQNFFLLEPFSHFCVRNHPQKFDDVFTSVFLSNKSIHPKSEIYFLKFDYRNLLNSYADLLLFCNPLFVCQLDVCCLAIYLLKS